MRIDVTVRAGGTERDVVITGPPTARIADVDALLGDPPGTRTSRTWWHGEVSLDPSASLRSAGIRSGSVLSIGAPSRSRSVPGVLMLHQTGGPGAGHVVALARGRIDIGRSVDCDVMLTDPDASRRHARIDVSANSILLSDVGSTNGTYLDGLRIDHVAVPLQPGSQVRIGDTTFAVSGPAESPATLIPADDATLRFVRPPRLLVRQPDRLIDLPVLPGSTRPRGVQWVTALLPAVAGGAIAWLTHSPQFLLFALLSPIMMVSGAVGDRMHWRRSRRRAAAAFASHHAAAEKGIAEALAAETAARRAAAPDPAVVLRTCLLPGSRLWERRRPDDDFLRLRVGTGDQMSTVQARFGTDVSPAGVVHGVPVCVDLRAGPVGLAGPPHVIDGLARWVLAQLATLHSPADVSLTMLLSRAAEPPWRWARWLPHTSGGAGVGESEWGTTVSDLAGFVEARRAAGRRTAGAWRGPWHVLVIDRAVELGDLPGLATLLAGGAEVGVTALCIGEDDAALPSACHTIVHVSGVTGTRAVVQREAGPCDRDVVLDDAPAEWADGVARRLAPVVDAGTDGLASMPGSCRFLELAALEEEGRIDEVRIVTAWSASSGGADTVLGIGPDGPVTLDLVADGPHLLVAGTTGAGKSELLQTLVAGLASRHPPDAVSFLLIDYKGGAAFAECAGLPHTVGLVTDLDATLTGRALRSLTSELRRRERLFAAAGVLDIGGYGRNSDADPLARLIIVVDEFATLAEDLPDFVRGLVGVAQRGRSLGVHLVLATQRPGGAVSAEIRANTTARIALRVTDAGDSRDVIDCADAAAIPRTRPGRAYLRTGATLVGFQTARVGGRPEAAADLSVRPLGPWRRASPACGNDSEPSDLSRLVTAITAAARTTGRPRARAPWVDPLPDRLARSSLPAPAAPTTITIGVVDLPEKQRRDLLTLDLRAGGSLLVAGAARTGRSGLLADLAIASAYALSPDDMHLYVIDGRGDLAAWIGGLPHCATVVGPNDLSVAPTLLRRVAAVLLSGGANSPARCPCSLLLVDGWETVVASLGDADALDCTESLTELLRTVTATTLTTVVTGDRTTLAPRFAGGFDERLLLRLGDRSEYGLAGIPPRDVPGAMPAGRGIRVSDGAALQLVHCGDAPGPEAIRAAVEGLRVGGKTLPAGRESATVHPATHTHDPVRLRALPRRIALDALPRSPGRIMLGAGGETAEPVSIDVFAGDRRMLIAGPPRSGRSTVLCSILVQSAGADVPAVVAATGRSPLRQVAARFGVAVIDPSATAERVGKIPTEPTLLLVDDCEAYLDEPAGDALTSWIRTFDAPLAAVVAGRTEDLAITSRGLGAQVRRSNCGLLLRPGPVDGELLGVRLPRRPAAGPPGRGVLVGDGRWGSLFEDGLPVPLQAALP